MSISFDEFSAHFSNEIREKTTFRGETTFLINPLEIERVCIFLKSKLGFTYLTDICGADRFTPEDRFEVVYNLFNPESKFRLRLKVWVNEENPVVQTVTSVWQSANWYERETYDMYGVIFKGHPDLRRMYMTEDFEYFPLRKEYPLVGVAGSIPLPEIDPKANNREAAERYNRGETV
ncbi:MAG: NADH-quinone oxidoreductase subunit C [Chloroherpetonaceae bacterium]|nr:NADH-quinone oxidoreductase subunit C [Chloroherpetonaceae bacterium]